jgi:DNA-binding NarL/FixJ family response regulator
VQSAVESAGIIIDQKRRPAEEIEEVMKVVLADDHTILIDAIKRVLEPEFSVVGTFSDGQSLLDSIESLNPDVAIIDIGMPVMDGLTAGIKLKNMMPHIRLIYLTMDQDIGTAMEAFRIGASGYVIKASAVSELVTAIRTVSWGGYYTSPALTQNMVGSLVHNAKHIKKSYRMTPRQREVIKLVAEGFSMVEIADQLGITPRTVQFHKYTVMQELEIDSNAELVSYAIRNRLI